MSQDEGINFEKKKCRYKNQLPIKKIKINYYYNFFGFFYNNMQRLKL